ncbi:unnamed protein product [Chrysoparadoxa australica]
MTPDAKYVVATGTYPPQVKVYELSELSLKFERHLDAEIVDVEVMSEGYEKLVFLLNNRTLAFHAAYGAHHTIRVPKFGRSMLYHKGNCDLYIGCVGSDIYRLNLEEGRFHKPITQPSGDSVTKLALNPVHQLLAVGTEEGVVSFWDTRAGGKGRGKKPIAELQLTCLLVRLTFVTYQVSALDFASDGLGLAVGISSAQCMLYDLRSAKPLLTKEHQYGLPINGIKFHGGSGRYVLSSDSKLVKIWSRDDGEVLTNIEAPAAINQVCIAHDSRGDSGLLMMAGEQARVMSYYIPALGPAPHWCSFIDSLTEELEEQAEQTVYEDYKFLTRAEVEELGIANLIGTSMLKGYMHGFFVDMKLYTRVKAISEPFAYDDWRKKKLQEKMEKKRKNRIAMTQVLPAVNQALAMKLLVKHKPLQQEDASNDEGSEREASAPAASGAAAAASNPLGDDRFASMFTSADFEVDQESQEFQRLHPNSRGGGHAAGATKRQEEQRRDSSEEEDDIGGDAGSGIGAAGYSEGSGSESDELSVRYSEHLEQQGRRRSRQKEGEEPRRKRQPRLMEMASEKDALRVGGVGKLSAQEQELRKRKRSMPLKQRLAEGEGGQRQDVQTVRRSGGSREFSFKPKARSSRK